MAEPNTGPHFSRVNYKDQIQPLVLMEYEKAQMYETKSLINQRIWKAVGEYLNVYDKNSAPIIKGNLIHIHPDVLFMIHQIHKTILEESDNMKWDSMNYYVEFISGKEYHDPITVRHFLKELVKRNEITRDDTHKKEKVFKNNDLTLLLAMDGLLGLQTSDVYNYIANLGVGNTAVHKYEKHTMAVRQMLTRIPTTINGSNSVQLVRMILLQLYKPFIQDRDVSSIVDQCISEAEAFLIRESNYYVELHDVMKPEFIQELKSIYSDHVDYSQIAHEKIELFKSALKKKNNKKRKICHQEDDEPKENIVKL